MAVPEDQLNQDSTRLSDSHLGSVGSQGVREQRQVRLYNVANDLDINAEVLVHEDVPEPTDLRPCDLWMRLCDLGRKVVRRFSDDLEVAFDRVRRHLGELRIGTQGTEVPLALLDCIEDVLDPLLRVASHSAMASASASRDTGSFSN